jgi:unsaturated chondroitin disaccharide hydrolase
VTIALAALLLFADPFALVQQQLAKLSELAGDGSPSHTVQGKWIMRAADDWVSGYFPGMLWMVYAETKDPAWLKRAQKWTHPIGRFRHDEGPLNFGVMFEPTFVNAWRLTGDRDARQTALDAAASMAKRYMPEGRYIRSWGRVDDPRQQGYIIIDCLIDLDLLFWAAREEGNPYYFEIAHQHALTTLAATVRPDGSTIQVVELDPQTGKKLWDKHKQGHSVDSTWSRGQGWALYMLPRLYRHTKDYRFLRGARKTADYYLANLPADFVPYWDFRAPNIPNEPRDSSAAALAGMGLWELSAIETDPARRKRYREAALETLDSLSRNYLSQEIDGRILKHGAYHVPAKIAQDESLIFGDYYYLELLLAVRKESR